MMRIFRLTVCVQECHYSIPAVAVQPKGHSHLTILISDVVFQLLLWPIDYVSLVFPLELLLEKYSEEEDISIDEAYEELYDLACIEALENEYEDAREEIS